MTATEIATPTQTLHARAADTISQATAVEQARAVAEVQAAIVVAQQVPRDTERALADMRDSCGRLALANRAFYSVPNRGNGPSVHLARELARIWGNIDYGVKELRRDDTAGESEVLAFAWDQQTNVRSMRSFIVPHERMKNGARQKLVDLGDIYLSNQNTGARAVRECIFTILPTWFTEEAQDRCRATLENGDGKPLPDRISDMVGAFERVGVNVQQIETKIGRPRRAWTAQDVAQMAVAYTDITRDGITIDELFPPARVTAAEINARAPQQAATTDSSTGGAPVPPAGDTPSADAAPVASAEGDQPAESCPACGVTPSHTPSGCPAAVEVDTQLGEEPTDQ